MLEFIYCLNFTGDVRLQAIDLFFSLLKGLLLLLDFVLENKLCRSLLLSLHHEPLQRDLVLALGVILLLHGLLYLFALAYDLFIQGFDILL